MKKILIPLLFLVMLVYGKTVKYTVADISNVRISGAHEHTLVIPPDYPSFMQDYTASFQIDYHYEYLDEPDDEPNEENEQENNDDDDDEASFSITMKWSVSGPGTAFAEGTDTASDAVTVVFSEGNVGDVLLT
ncbi:MAG: hypothetical protein IJJ33_20490, partial [Victivallales bacterium]|nr:hypothetical protein [Victivallales bacterium]